MSTVNSSTTSPMNTICSQGPQWPYYSPPLEDHVEKLHQLKLEFAQIKDDTSLKINKRYDRILIHNPRLIVAMERLLASGASMAVEKDEFATRLGESP